MKTVIIQVGNSDGKLLAKEYSCFVEKMDFLIDCNATSIHFSGGSSSWKPWINYCWVIEIDESFVDILKRGITLIRQEFRQDSVAWIEGETKFI